MKVYFITSLLYAQSFFCINYVFLNNEKFVKKEQVLSCLEFQKKCDFISENNKYSKSLQNWNLNQMQLEMIFKNMESFDFNSYDYVFNRMPCWVEGTALFKGDTVNFQVNSGGGVIVTNKDSVYYFGCRSKLCKPFFIIETNSD